MRAVGLWEGGVVPPPEGGGVNREAQDLEGAAVVGS